MAKRSSITADTPLTGKQPLFVAEYLIDFNGTQAAIRAGYSKRTAKDISAENLSKPNIQKAINEAMTERINRTKADADYVLERLVSIDKMDVLDILNHDGSLKSVGDWPLIWRQYISGIDVSEIYEGSGDERKLAGLLKKIKWPDKLKNLELLGKHVNVQAFKERTEVDLGSETQQTLRDIIKAIDGTSKGLPNG